MAHISVPEGVPGIRSLVMFRPESGQHLYALAQVLLRGDSPLSEAERELIAAFVSSRNDRAPRQKKFQLESRSIKSR